LLTLGCGGPPQLGAQNVRLVESLRTAISARRTDWLEQAAKTASARHESGQLDDRQYAALDAIVQQARAGEWEAAEAAVVDLAKGQQAAGP
jgi:hypothetical protein